MLEDLAGAAVLGVVLLEVAILMGWLAGGPEVEYVRALLRVGP